ncbi:MAG: hypothetical protein Q8S01_05640 [Ignavibacteria bacterium]|nr:hypothetical protein [Ignavibacteria bacterium]
MAEKPNFGHALKAPLIPVQDSWLSYNVVMTTPSSSSMDKVTGEKPTSARGRKARRPIETLKSKAWGSYVFHVAGTKTQHQFDQVWDKARKRIPRERQIHPAPEIHRSKQGVKSPNEQTLTNVERYFPGTKSIYTHGIGKYPIWDILDGPLETSRQTLMIHVTELQGYGLVPPISAYLDRVVQQYFLKHSIERSAIESEHNGVALNWLELNNKNALQNRNVVAQNLARTMADTPTFPDALNSAAGFTVDDVSAIFAAYRLAVFTGDREREFLYYVNGISKVVEALYAPWGISIMELSPWLQSVWDQFHVLERTHVCAKRTQN